MASESMKKKQEEEIDLLKLAKVLWKRIWIILLCAMILGAAGYYWTYRKMYTTYQSSAMLYVNNNSVSLGSAKLSITSGDIKAVNNLMETYSVILTARNTLNEIISETGIPFTYEQLKQMITTETVGDTAIFKITVTSSDPELSAHLANSILEVLPNKISTVVEGSSAQIVDYAVTGTPVVNGNPIKTAAIGALIGVVLSSGVIIFLSLIDTKVRSEEYLLEAFRDIPILTSVPDLNESGKGGYYGYRRSESKSSDNQPPRRTDSGDSDRPAMRPGNEGK
jgi:capsular polysaccharide biosynthesis protein